MFDPYHKWLGIPKDARPPTHYQLLGIAPDEADAEVIKEAALRQTSHVRVFQTGPHAELCTRVLNEIAQARAVLLNPKLRHEYDDRRAPPLADVATAPPVPVARDFVRRLRRPQAERVLAAVGYGLLLLLGFTASSCLTYQSLRTTAEPAERTRSGAPVTAPPTGDHAP